MIEVVADVRGQVGKLIGWKRVQEVFAHLWIFWLVRVSTHLITYVKIITIRSC